MRISHNQGSPCPHPSPYPPSRARTTDEGDDGHRPAAARPGWSRLYIGLTGQPQDHSTAEGTGIPANEEMEGGAYGRRVARLFHLDRGAMLATTMLQTAQLAVTRLATEGDGIAKTDPIPAEKAYVVSLHLLPVSDAELWTAGSRIFKGWLNEGAIDIAQLEEGPAYRFGAAFDCLQFHIPDLVFDELANDYGLPLIGGLTVEPGTVDPVLLQLGRALLPALASEGSASRLFFNHVSLAICSHLALRYGGARRDVAGAQMRLSTRQERVAKALLAADLTEEPSIAELAQACNLPLRRFLQAFRETTGMTPCRWLRQFRIEQAKQMLFSSSMPLTQVAYACGFADQSHFTRAFSAAAGLTPGAWRRARCG